MLQQSGNLVFAKISCNRAKNVVCLKTDFRKI